MFDPYYLASYWSGPHDALAFHELEEFRTSSPA
jgi:hypothetical protein